jgi:hypothetical protein
MPFNDRLVGLGSCVQAGRHSDHMGMSYLQPSSLSEWTYTSELERAVSACFSSGRVSAPRARGDQGIAPTPKCCRISVRIHCNYFEINPCLQRRKHLTLFLPINQIVMVLHRYKRSQVIGDGITCNMFGEPGIWNYREVNKYFAWCELATICQHFEGR